jgi:hypothetical protein
MRPVFTAAALIAFLGTARADAVDHVKDARLFYRVVACTGGEPLPQGLDAPTIAKHCEEMARRFASFTDRYLTPAQRFFAGVRPAGLPQAVVYPFGGGDLVSALVTYPDATEITTVSLEHAGDPTRLAGLTGAKQLAAALKAYRDAIHGLLTLNDSTSENLRKLEKGAIPGQLSFHLTGMAVMGFEPVSLRFFRLEDDGSIAYLAQADVDALASTRAKKVKHGWVDTDFSEAYRHMELVFRKAGDPKAPAITHRHIAANLADKAFKGSALEKHLLAKGKVVALTKAASFLMWEWGFSAIRDYLLANMVWMASDATGIPARHARKAGFKQITYGSFKGPFLPEANATVAEEMVKLWEAQPRRKLGFRYGYVDSELAVHLMITEPVPPPEPKRR